MLVNFNYLKFFVCVQSTFPRKIIRILSLRFPVEFCMWICMLTLNFDQIIKLFSSFNLYRQFRCILMVHLEKVKIEKKQIKRKKKTHITVSFLLFDWRRKNLNKNWLKILFYFHFSFNLNFNYFSLFFFSLSNIGQLYPPRDIILCQAKLNKE